MKIIPNSEFFENVEQMLSEGKNVELRCLGGSMQPYLRGDGREIIIASPFSQDELIPGIIVLFRYHDRHICHRIIGRKGNHLLIQGDGVVKNREHVPVSDVLGVIHTIIRRNKQPVSPQSKSAQSYWRYWKRLSFIRRYLLYAYRGWIKLMATHNS